MDRYHRGFRGYRRGQGTSVAGGFGPLDPTNTVADGWWRGNYSASPWNGSVSLGASGSRNLTEATNPPTAGAAVNGFTPADYNGTNQILNGTLVSTYLGAATSYTLFFLFKVDNFTVADPGATQPFNCPTFWGQTANSICGGPAGTGGTGVFRYGHYDGSTWDSASVAISTGTWTCGVVRYDGINIEVGKNGLLSASTPQGTPAGLGGTIISGRAFPAVFLDGQIMEIIVYRQALSGVDIARITQYMRNRYGLAL